MLEVTLLGQFAVHIGGQPLKITSRPAQALLAYLLLTTGSRHRREKLTALLWPDADEENARQNLRNALWKLNKVIGGGFLLVDKISVGFDSEASYTLDTAVLEETKSSQTGDLVSSVSAYQGELLPGLYDEWVLLERERLRAVFERKMQTLLDRLAEEGRWQDVLQWAEKWIALGQTPEPAYRALMNAHYWLGDIAGMAGVYRRCVKALEDELGLEPSIETQELYQRYVKGGAPPQNRRHATSPQKKKDAPNPPFFLKEAPDGVPARPKVVGREEELARLQHFLERALAGHGQVVFVTGEAGQGKTSLLGEFSRFAQEKHPDLVVAVGNCNAYTGIGDPFLPFRDLISMLTGDVEAQWLTGTITRDHAMRLWNFLPDTAQALVDQGAELLGSFISGDALAKRMAAYEGDDEFDLLRTRVERTSESTRTLGQDKNRLFEAYAKVLEALSRRRPLVLMLDDLHWADTTSIGLLFHLGRRIAGSRVLLIGAYRPEDVIEDRAGEPHPLRRVLSEFERDFGDIRVELNKGLTKRAFIDSLLDSEPNRLGQKFRDRLTKLTEGNALFTVEMLQEMKDRGGLWRDDEGYWVEGAGLAWEALPARIEGVIRTRIERVDSTLREALTLGSVEGVGFTAEVVAIVLDTEARQLIRRLSSEVDRHHHIVEGQEVQRVSGQRLSKYRFRHSLFQQYLYNCLSRMDRAYLHEEVGNTLEALYGEQASTIAVELARHFHEAGLEGKTVRYLTQAGKQAIELSAHEEALTHLRQGLELIEVMPPTQETARQELELLLLLGSSLQALYGYAALEVGSVFERAHALCEKVGDVKQCFSAMWSLTLFHTQHANFEKARKLGSTLLSLAKQEGDEGLLLQAHHTLWFASVSTGEFAAGREHAEQGIALYDSTEHQGHAFLYGGHDPGVCARLYGARALWHLGYPDRALARTQEALALAETLTHPNSLAHAFTHAAEVYLLRREGPAAQELAEKAIGLAEAHGFSHWLAWGTILRGAALVEQGQVEAGIEEMRRGLISFSAIGTVEALTSLARLVLAHAQLGQVSEGFSALDEAFTAVEQRGEDGWNAELYRLRGELLRIKGGSEEEAESCFRRAIEISREQGTKALELRAAISFYRFCAHRDGVDEALRILTDVYNGFTEGANTADLIEAKALLTTLRTSTDPPTI